MDLQVIDQMPGRQMTEEEQSLSHQFYVACQTATNQSDRSIQASGHRVGVSDLGHCSERVRRSLAGLQEPEVDKTKAFIGTAYGDHVEMAMTDMFPDLIRQAEVEIVLRGDTGTYVLTGHPDLVDPRGRLIDVKSVGGLGRVRRTGPTQQQQFQRHMYAKATYAAGLFDDDVTLDDVTVCNVWFDRTGEEREPYVHSEPYSEQIVEAATSWLDDVVYAYQVGEEARKEPPIQMCEKTCGFYLDCRAGTGPHGLIEDPALVAAVQMYQEAAALRKQAKLLDTEAKAALQGVEGSTGEFSVSWSKVGGGSVSYERAPYEKLNIKKIR